MQRGFPARFASASLLAQIHEIIWPDVEALGLESVEHEGAHGRIYHCNARHNVGAAPPDYGRAGALGCDQVLWVMMNGKR